MIDNYITLNGLLFSLRNYIVVSYYLLFLCVIHVKHYHFYLILNAFRI